MARFSEGVRCLCTRENGPLKVISFPLKASKGLGVDGKAAGQAECTRMKRYLVGFAVFLAYYIVARNLENKVALIQKLTNVGS
jgi:hypothetical protein